MGRYGPRIGFVLSAAAVVLAAVGGSAVALGAPAWLAGAVAAVSALTAGTTVDRVFRGRDERAGAKRRRREVLDPLREQELGGRNDLLGLLRADRSPMPFRGRQREIGRMADWCADDAACPVMMVSGPAGVGKSRLALEFASRLPGQWEAGWLHPGAGEAAISAVGACGDPAVVLVDDADGRADVVPLLNALAEEHTGPAIRVLLVTRSAAGLRASLAARLEERYTWIADRAVEVALQPQGGREDFERWFGEAVSAFAATQGTAVPALPASFRAGEVDAAQPMLVLLAQALLAVLDHAGGGDPRDLSSGQVAQALMKHEAHRWRSMSATWEWGSGGPLPEALQERSIAAFALLGPADQTEAEEIIRRIPELRDAPAERLFAVAAWVAALYPARGNGPLIRPDMIGEWFVVSQLSAHPVLARSLRVGLTDAQAARALSFLARAADRIDQASKLFADFAAGDVRRQVLAAAEAALTGDAGRRLLDAVVARHIMSSHEWTIDQLIDLNRLIPEHVLQQTRVAIVELIVSLYRAMAAEDPVIHQASLANVLQAFGSGLAQVGRYQDAVAATEEAITLYRGLAADNPTFDRTDLAPALTDLGRRLAQVGRYQDAVAATEEAITLYRGLAADNLASHQEALAEALHTLGYVFAAVRRYQEAAAATEEAVTLYRGLAADNPIYDRANLASAVMNLGSWLSEIGRHPVALAAAEEAVTLYRGLAADHPATHEAGYAKALFGLAGRLVQVGRSQDALPVIQESVTLYRSLAADNPAVHSAALAFALINLAPPLGEAGRHQDALAAVQEAVTLTRRLAADNPAVHQANLANALLHLSDLLERVGNHDDALASRTESVHIYGELASGDPDVYQDEYRLRLSALRRDFDRHGMRDEALLHHLNNQPKQAQRHPSDELPRL
jgi:tetratricopeptide (TPR) repeat protein